MGSVDKKPKSCNKPQLGVTDSVRRVPESHGIGNHSRPERIFTVTLIYSALFGRRSVGSSRDMCREARLSLLKGLFRFEAHQCRKLPKVGDLFPIRQREHNKLSKSLNLTLREQLIVSSLLSGFFSLIFLADSSKFWPSNTPDIIFVFVFIAKLDCHDYLLNHSNTHHQFHPHSPLSHVFLGCPL